MRRVWVGLACLLAAGCVTTPSPPPVTPERRAAITAAADACQREHPTVQAVAVDRFGVVTATYRDVQGQTVATAPFFQCVRTRLGAAPPTPAAAPAAPVTGSAPTVVPAASPPPSRPAAARLQELEALRQQRLISEEEYQAARRRILEGL